MDPLQGRPVRACRTKNPINYHEMTNTKSILSTASFLAVQKDQKKRQQKVQKKAGALKRALDKTTGQNIACKISRQNNVILDSFGTKSKATHFVIPRKPPRKARIPSTPKTPRNPLQKLSATRGYNKSSKMSTGRNLTGRTNWFFGLDNSLHTSFEFATTDEEGEHTSASSHAMAGRSCPRYSQGPAWHRGFRKFHQPDASELSPVKPILYTILPSIFLDDHLVMGYTWVLNMSEEFYYDNALSLLSRYMSSTTTPDHAENMARAIRNNYRPMTLAHINKYWRDIRVLGEGTFGIVYRITDSRSEEHLAIKYIKAIKDNSEFEDHTRKLIDYLHERNHLIQASNSEFTMQFKSSFSFPDISGIFLVFEWCICDISLFNMLQRKILQKNVPYLSDMLLETEYNSDTLTFTKIYKSHSQYLKTDLNTVLVIYVFEMFCILDFLSTANLIHCDIKPENIMIGQNFHLKLGDFGLVQNTRFITRGMQIHMLSYDIVIEHLDYEKKPCGVAGTPTFMDPESFFYKYFWMKSKTKSKQILDSEDQFIEGLELPTNSREAEATFMTDVWAGGLVMTQLLFMGQRFLDTTSWSDEVRQLLEFTENNWKDELMQVMVSKWVNKPLIQNGFVSAMCGNVEDPDDMEGNEFMELMQCLASIFRGRSLRCHEYSKFKNVTGTNGFIRKMAYIDISAVETIPIFQCRQLKARTVYTFPLNPRMNHLRKTLFSDKRTPTQFKKAEKWFNQLRKDAPTTQFFPMKPGYQINFDNNQP